MVGHGRRMSRQSGGRRRLERTVWKGAAGPWPGGCRTGGGPVTGESVRWGGRRAAAGASTGGEAERPLRWARPGFRRRGVGPRGEAGWVPGQASADSSSEESAPESPESPESSEEEAEALPALAGSDFLARRFFTGRE